jgi:hypothetical protein
MTSSKRLGSDDKLFNKTTPCRRTASEITPLEYWTTTLRLIQKRKWLLRKRVALLIQLQQLAAEANAGLQAASKGNRQSIEVSSKPCHLNPFGNATTVSTASASQARQRSTVPTA